MFSSAGISTSRKQVSVTFNSSTNWTCPAISSVDTLSGKGQDGAPAQTSSHTVTVVTVNYHTSGSGAGPTANDWSNAQAVANDRLATINAGGGTVNTLFFDEYSDGTETITNNNQVIASDAGSASLSYTGGWQSSGPITASGTAEVSYTTSSASSTGSASSALGKDFLGGNGVPAVSASYSNVPVTYGTVYPITVAPGGFITITYTI